MPLHFHRSDRLAALAVVCAVLSFASASPAQNQFDLNDEMFNQWLYGNSKPLDVASEISAEIEGVDRVCSLSPEQKAKLKLAGRGDEVRFSERVDELRARLAGKSYDQNEINEIYLQIQPLAQEYRAGVLGKSSLFYKVLNRTLEPQQQEVFQRVQAERRAARHAARIGLYIAQLERGCPLTHEQRTALQELLHKETRPASQASEYDAYVLMFQASKIPEERFETFLDEAQLRMVKQQFQQGRGMEQFLKQQGLLPDADE
ncbi:MAG: hypothetical protein WD851_03645 [Pirellulales bacterium]